MSLVLFSKAPVGRLSPKGGLFPICRLSLYGRKRFKDCCRPVVLKRTLRRTPFRQGAHNFLGPHPNQQRRIPCPPNGSTSPTPKDSGSRHSSTCLPASL